MYLCCTCITRAVGGCVQERNRGGMDVQKVTKGLKGHSHVIWDKQKLMFNIRVDY